MIRKCILLVLVLLVARSGCNNFSPAALSFILRISSIAQCANTNSRSVCIPAANNGCSQKYAACFGNGFGFEGDCPENTPYCITENNEGVCTANIPENCQTAGDTAFQCTDEGVYPNPSNCDRFVNCVRQRDRTLSAVPSICPPNYVFTPNVPVVFCKRRVTAAECATVSCRNVQRPTFLPYGTLYRQYYAFCQDNTSTPSIVKCFDNHVADVSTTPPRCNFVCPREGIYPSPNQNSFYFCYIGTNGRLTSRVQTCPEGYIFDSTTLRCILNPQTDTPEDGGETQPETPETNPNPPETNPNPPETNPPETNPPETNPPETNEPETNSL